MPCSGRDAVAPPMGEAQASGSASRAARGHRADDRSSGESIGGQWCEANRPHTITSAHRSCQAAKTKRRRASCQCKGRPNSSLERPFSCELQAGRIVGLPIPLHPAHRHHVEAKLETLRLWSRPRMPIDVAGCARPCCCAVLAAAASRFNSEHKRDNAQRHSAPGRSRPRLGLVKRTTWRRTSSGGGCELCSTREPRATIAVTRPRARSAKELYRASVCPKCGLHANAGCAPMSVSLQPPERALYKRLRRAEYRWLRILPPDRNNEKHETLMYTCARYASDLARW